MTMACSIEIDKPIEAMTRDELILSAMSYAPMWIHRVMPGWRRLRYADDLLQDAYVAICDAATRYDPSRGSWKGYAAQATHNACVNRLNWERGINRHVYRRIADTPEQPRRWESLDALVGRNITLGDVVSDPRSTGWEDTVSGELDCARIIDMARLTELERGAWRLAQEEERSYSEAAKMLGVSSKAQDNALQRARRKLREVYQRMAEWRKEEVGAPWRGMNSGSR